MIGGTIVLGTETGRHGGRTDGDSGRPGWFRIARTLHDLPIPGQYALATALVLLTLCVRYGLATDRDGYHFVFFMPAVLITSMVLTHGSGVLAVVLSAVVIKVFFVPPPFSPWFADPDDLLAIVVFTGSGLVTALMGGALHKALFRLADANERISASEHEKELLLHELAHRFRNDLTNLTAILHHQARNVADPLARSELMLASKRIHVLGRVHQRLGRSARVVDVEIEEFLKDLCEDLRLSMIGAQPIALVTEIEPARLPFGTAITLGLIVNELVQNALKYAFPGDRPGVVVLRFRERAGQFHLTLADDGIGEAASPSSSSGLGQRLIGSFVRQLRGSCQVRLEAGRAVEISFPSVSSGGAGRSAA